MFNTKKKNILKGMYQHNLELEGRPVTKPIVKSPKRRAPVGLIFSFVIVSMLASAGVTSWDLPVELRSVFKEVLAYNSDIANENNVASPLKNVPIAANDIHLERSEQGPQIKEDVEKLSDAKEKTVDLNNLASFAEPGVPLADLFGLGVKTIVIDPGHGGKDPGAIGQLGTYEKDIALAIAKQLKSRLMKHKHYNVLLTRETDKTIALNERVRFANDNGADLFISIHINSFPSKNLNFIETFYFGPNSDKKVMELAAVENVDSHYHYGEFKKMIKKIGDTLKHQESQELAAAVQRSLYKNITKINKKASDHGIKPAPFVVLLGLDAPSILTEVTNINDKKEEERLKSTVYRNKIAMFIEDGIVNYLNNKTTLGGTQNAAKEKNLAKAYYD